MRKIFKYTVNHDAPGGITNLSLPHGAKFLSLQAQRGIIRVWFEAIPTRPANWHVEIVCRPTGQEWVSADRGEYLGTALLSDDTLVFHCYLRDT